ncbi:TonB-dependent receptor [Verminephrobacter eiseniae]|uniref:TonB-dependent receptor n=1 Tax=Verminephrobacter eiseniae TaxID=364317 RepID=UPI002237ECDE|nr:TonB-dependent receptor [Verminephrobacter eiseniae]
MTTNTICEANQLHACFQMTRPTRSVFTLSLLLTSASYAGAQEAGGAAAPAEGSLAPVVVSATKQGKTLFETAGSVSLIDGKAVESRNLDGLSDVAQQVPNVYFTNFTGSSASLTIRGLGFSDDESDSTSTSVLLDGVPVNAFAFGSMFDLERIEVLRGPQSTLYGQNSMGGLVAMRTRDPSFTFGGDAQFDYGTGNRRRVSVSTDLPLTTDTAVRLSVGAENADGFVKNPGLGRDDTTGWQSRFARLKFLHRDAGGGEWRFGLHHSERKGGDDFFAPIELARRHESNVGDAGANNIEYTLLTGSYDRRFSNGNQLAVTLGGSTSRWSYWTPASLFGAPSGFDSKTRQFSAEAHLSSAPASVGGIDWMAGTYASTLNKDAPYVFEIPGSMRSATTATVKGSTAAVFGEVGWRFASQWRVAGALRYENDRRRMNWTSAQTGSFDSNGDGVSDTNYGTFDQLPNVKVRDNVLLPRLTLEFRPDDNQFVWATVARGYKASGFNLYAFDPRPAGTPYAPEYGNYAELGYRVRGDGNAWNIGGTVFYTKLRDQQVVIVGAGGQSLVANAGRSHNQGIELTGAIRPASNLEISAFAGYVRAVYDVYTNNNVNYAGQQFPNTPRQNFGVAVNWKPAPGWEAGLSVRRLGSSTLVPANSVPNPAYTLVDAQVSYRVQRWTFGVYAKNLTDATYFTRALDKSTVVAGAPRTVGVRVGVDF